MDNCINGFQQKFSCNIWLSSFRKEYSTKSLYHSYRSSALASQNGGSSNPLPGCRQFSSSHVSTEQKSRKMLFYLTALVFAMVGGSYAAVPLYRRFCQATGYGGTVQRREVWLSFSSKVLHVLSIMIVSFASFCLLNRRFSFLSVCWRKDCPTWQKQYCHFKVLLLILNCYLVSGCE